MDQESIFPEVPTERLYKPIGIYAATFFGGPLVAGYLISSNYNALNERSNAIKTWIFAILGTILIIWFSVPPGSLLIFKSVNGLAGVCRAGFVYCGNPGG